MTYACSNNCNLDLALVRTHQLSKFVTNTFEKTQSVVVGEGLEKVLDSVTLVSSADVLLQFGDDL